MKRRILIVLAVVIPLSIFFASRQAASKRPIIVGRHQGATGLQFSPDGKRMFSRSGSEIAVWDLITQQRQGQWKSGLDYVFSRDGQRVVAAGCTNYSSDIAYLQSTIYGAIREARTGKTLLKFSDGGYMVPGHPDRVQQVLWSGDEREIWVLSESFLRHFDARSGRSLKRIDLAFSKNYNAFAGRLMSPDGSFVVGSGNDLQLIFWNAKTGALASSWKIQPPVAPDTTALVSAISPDSQFLAVGFDGKAAGVTRIYRIPDRKFWEAPLGLSPFKGFSDDSRFVTYAENSTFLARDVNSGREVWRMQVPNAQSCFLAPDSLHLYNVDKQGIIRRWDVR